MAVCRACGKVSESESARQSQPEKEGHGIRRPIVGQHVLFKRRKGQWEDHEYRQINKCRIVAFRSAKVAYIRGAKSDSYFHAA